MKKINKKIKLENISTLTGKKEGKDLVYFYKNFEFNLHKIGANAEGKDMYRITPVNFDNKILKTFSKKTYPSKGYSTIQADNLQETLQFTFDEIIRIKEKKAAAKKAYEKALKEGKIEETPKVVEVSVDLANVKPTTKKPLFRKKIDNKQGFNKSKNSKSSNFSKENDFKKATSISKKFDKPQSNSSNKKNDSFNKNDRTQSDRPNRKNDAYNRSEKSNSDRQTSSFNKNEKSQGNRNAKSFSKNNKSSYGKKSNKRF